MCAIWPLERVRRDIRRRLNVRRPTGILMV